MFHVSRLTFYVVDVFVKIWVSASRGTDEQKNRRTDQLTNCKTDFDFLFMGKYLFRWKTQAPKRASAHSRGQSGHFARAAPGCEWTTLSSPRRRICWGQCTISRGDSKLKVES